MSATQPLDLLVERKEYDGAEALDGVQTKEKATMKPGWTVVVVSITFLVTLVVAVASSHPASEHRVPASYRVVTDVGQANMLESDQLMLDQMRTAAPLNMQSMIERNSMWLDPYMVRLQEQNQAQLDRMIARRP
ncbi:MAG: hypothetical protein BMS9Abin12_1858 [Acidimicrobiia bacterium]|nr:MAG: hypothetical protein BMS9Abin12_1858 [Acidimicrobiia bacterium]